MIEDAKRGAAETTAADEAAEAESDEPAAAGAPEDKDSEASREPVDTDAVDAITLEVTEQRPSRAPVLLALFACLLAFCSAAGVAYLWMEQPADTGERIASDLQRLSGEIREANSSLAEKERALAELQTAGNAASDGLDELRRTLDQRLRVLEAVPGRLSNLEASLSALQGISSGLRDTWLLAEAEYYLQIANAQLQLAANPELAGIALELADERLASLGNPALTDVRRRIADEMRQLEAMNSVDLAGAVLTLGSLADTIASLPLNNDIELAPRDDPALTGEQTGTDRALASLKSAISDVISVRRSDTSVKPLLPPEAAYFLRNNLTLQLQTARLAMLRGEQAVLEESLADAAAWIGEYYDPESRAVTSALDTINELRELRLTVQKPDISGSLTGLRQFIALRDERERVQPGTAQ